MSKVSFEEVETVMDRMMQVPILQIIGKQDKCHEESVGSFFNPNLIMDVRHSFYQKPVLTINNLKPTVQSSPNVDLNAIRKAREDHLLQLELRRFEKSLQNARPKFLEYKACKKNVIPNSDDKDFWRSVIVKRNCQINDENVSPATNSDQTPENNCNFCPPNITVTIKDKVMVTESKEENESILQKVFYILREHVRTRKYYRDLQMKVKQHLTNRLLQRCLMSWKNYTQKCKKIAQKKKEQEEMTYERKIEIFVNAIVKKQEEIIKLQKAGKKDVRIKSAPEVPTRPTVMVRQVCVVESPAQNRLKAQQKIIEEQRLKLAKQRRIIEEMQLKEFQNETRTISKKTLESAKEVLEYCGPATKRTLLQIMREKGFSNKFEDKPLRVPSPPEFLIRMEARAEARKERVRKTKEAREKRVEEEKRREEMIRKKQEEERWELQLKARQEANRQRKEQEKQKVLKLEKQRQLMEMTDQFYQRYLLKRFIIFPFKKLIEIKRNDEARAQQHYSQVLLRRFLNSWKTLMNDQLNVKLQMVTSFCHHKLLARSFAQWKSHLLEMKQNCQVAHDFCDMKLQIRVINVWKHYVSEERVIDLKKEQIAIKHYEKRLLIASFAGWKRYLEIAEELRESEQRKEELRALVQKVIPDFDPKQRGVAVDD